jgi:hypothetical protein
LTAVWAACCTTGLALKAIPRPAALSMSRSFAPSPIAIVAASGTPASAANLRSARALPARSTMSPTTRPVSLPSTISSSFAAEKSMPSSSARRSVIWLKPPETIANR